MAVYGHARWHEAVCGGVTRALLQSITVPVLMSNRIRTACVRYVMFANTVVAVDRTDTLMLALIWALGLARERHARR
ncbi:hypothetical protein [Paraburkholderia youngii]|uniref:hypothetical protein n=1 Tax=Paraburkholderia youngii TaxID=2782701 RepID=UPI003D23870D